MLDNKALKDLCDGLIYLYYEVEKAFGSLREGFTLGSGITDWTELFVLD